MYSISKKKTGCIQFVVEAEIDKYNRGLGFPKNASPVHYYIYVTRTKSADAIRQNAVTICHILPLTSRSKPVFFGFLIVVTVLETQNFKDMFLWSRYMKFEDSLINYLRSWQAMS